MLFNYLLVQNPLFNKKFIIINKNYKNHFLISCDKSLDFSQVKSGSFLPK